MNETYLVHAYTASSTLLATSGPDIVQQVVTGTSGAKNLQLLQGLCSRSVPPPSLYLYVCVCISVLKTLHSYTVTRGLTLNAHKTKVRRKCLGH